MILFLLLLVLFLYLLFGWKDKKWKNLLITAMSILLASFFAYFLIVTVDYFKEKDAGAARLPATENGNPYYHDENSMIENGHKIYTYISYDELPSAWSKRSLKPYAEVEATLIRYLNSLGLHKDSAGVAQLSSWDVQNIENEIANVEYARKFGLRKNLYATFFSLSAYHHYRQVANSSLLQRVELWRNSWSLIKRNFWLGVGIGDHKQALDEELVKTDSPLKDTRNKGCHNQFLTIWLSSGFFAFLALLAMLFVPFLFAKPKISLLYLLFFVILFTSMFTEDTLDTNAGVFLFSLFNALLLFVYPKIGKSV
jgi:O-antigen ligase